MGKLQSSYSCGFNLIESILYLRIKIKFINFYIYFVEMLQIFNSLYRNSAWKKQHNCIGGEMKITIQINVWSTNVHSLLIDIMYLRFGDSGWVLFSIGAPSQCYSFPVKHKAYIRIRKCFLWESNNSNDNYLWSIWF